ncbi:MAG: hypothetical protein A3H79_00725 [Candidatus Levybacteria bacterium RIFCSPLOWO2_02_FULL_36_8b]|nr:MAG: hypothetical protein A3H79_00725 [Candidatus Levybacteria bacterium RIFCSPLOWO2_02_FULL_36_8b]
MRRIGLISLFSLLISAPIILPFFHTGYFPTHDGEWAVVRLADMFRMLRDFQIPARYSGELNFGYGYPLFNFAYPFPYYLGIAIHFLGFGFVNTIKIIFAGSVIFSAFFMFLASRNLWKNTWAGIISAIMYIYLPYRMVDLYVRGSIGESLSFALFPLLFYLSVKLIKKSSVLLISSIAFVTGALIMTHNIMAVLFMPIFIVFSLIQIILKKRRAIKPFVISIVLSFGLSAFFWVPAIFEKSNILLSQTPIADRSLYFATLKQFIFPKWGYGVPTDPAGFSYQLGLAHLAAFAFAILSLLFSLIKNKRYLKEHFMKITSILTIITVFFVFLLFKPSDFLWRNIPFLSEINYPWITLGILGFLVSLLAGSLFKHTLGKYVAVSLVIISVFTVLPYAKPEYYFNKGDDYYLTNDATTTSSNELMPLWVKKFTFQRPAKKVEIAEGAGTVSNTSYNSKKIIFDVLAKENTKIRINTIYYPGWKAYIDNKEVQIFYENEYGAIDILIPSGKHLVKANFTETPLRLISDIISVSSFFVLLLFIIKRNKYAIS